MTAEQLDLLTAPVTAGTHRQADSASSTLSAKATDPSPDQAAIFAHLVAIGGRGTLDDACDALPNRLRGCVSRRLTDLEEGRRIRRTDELVVGRYGRPLAVWEVVR